MSQKIFRSIIVLLLVIGLVVVVQAPQSARAAGPWYVTTTGDDNNDCLNPSTACATINGALGKASAGDIVNVSVGTYTGAAGEVVLINKDIILSGGWDTSFTTLSGKSIIDGDGTRRGIEVNGLSVNVTIENFIFQNCYTFFYQAPGVIFLYGTLTLNNSVIQNNQTTGIYYEGPGTTSLFINNSTIANNVSPDIPDVAGGLEISGSGSVNINNSLLSGNSGSGIVNKGGVVTINTSTISNNQGAAWGAGIHNTSNLSIISSTIDHNTTASGYNIFGGGVFNGGSLTISNSSISNNVSYGQGGGLYNGGIAHINTSAISENVAAVSGGGVYVSGNWQVTSIMLIATNSTISNNKGGTGGGLYLADSYNGKGSSASLNNVTITQNVATNADGTGLGGGIYVQYLSSADVKDSLIVGNNAMEGPDCSGNISSSGYNLIAETTDCTFSPTIGDLLNVDPLLGPLQNNGGSTFTHALLAGSPAIDAGNPAGCTDQDGNLLTTDQRSVARPQGAACDIGAFELEILLIDVFIDIKPGSEVNPINTKSKGTIPVAILSTVDFDAPVMVDITALTFGNTGEEVSLALCNNEDINEDGLTDLVCHFYTQSTGFQVGDTEGILMGQRMDGIPIEGYDGVNILK